MADDQAPIDINAAVRVELSQRRWRLDPALVVIVVLVAALLIVVRLSHRPQLVYPDGAKRAILTVQSSARPVNPKLVEYYSRLYELDPCREGKKYATVCQDGEVIWRVEEGVCVDHGGTKDWVVCR